MDLRRISRGVALGCGSAAIAVAVLAANGIGPATAADDTPSDLTIVFNEGTGTSGAATWHLICAPDGGDHPDPANACAALTKHATTALSAPAGQICTNPIPTNYGGPQTARITGTWQGTAVDTTFTRINGCAITRWDALVPLLPAVQAGT